MLGRGVKLKVGGNVLRKVAKYRWIRPQMVA